MPPPTPTPLQKYMAHFRQRRIRDRLQQQQHHQHGWEQASIAADILKQRYGVKAVFLVGSLLAPETVHPNSYQIFQQMLQMIPSPKIPLPSPWGEGLGMRSRFVAFIS